MYRAETCWMLLQHHRHAKLAHMTAISSGQASCMGQTGALSSKGLAYQGGCWAAPENTSMAPSRDLGKACSSASKELPNRRPANSLPSPSRMGAAPDLAPNRTCVQVKSSDTPKRFAGRPPGIMQLCCKNNTKAAPDFIAHYSLHLCHQRRCDGTFDIIANAQMHNSIMGNT